MMGFDACVFKCVAVCVDSEWTFVIYSEAYVKNKNESWNIFTPKMLSLFLITSIQI